MKNKKRFLDLLNYSNQLKKSDKNLMSEDHKAFSELFTYIGNAENNLHLQEKNQYLKLFDNLLKGKLSVRQFTIFFLQFVDRNIGKAPILHSSLKKNLEDSLISDDELTIFLVENPKNFSILIDEVLDTINEYDFDNIDRYESKLKKNS